MCCPNCTPKPVTDVPEVGGRRIAVELDEPVRAVGAIALDPGEAFTFESTGPSVRVDCPALSGPVWDFTRR